MFWAVMLHAFGVQERAAQWQRLLRTIYARPARRQEPHRPGFGGGCVTGAQKHVNKKLRLLGLKGPNNYPC